MTAFFDTSALIALTDPTHANHSWSLAEFTSRQTAGPIIINDIIYAEFSAGMPDRSAVDAVVSRFGLQRALRDDGALYDAGQRFKLYRSANGPKTNVLSDFFVGAAAKSLGVPLVTANPRDFRRFFVGLTIVHPTGQEIVS
jgi:predicted nucleic acid-binding protein